MRVRENWKTRKEVTIKGLMASCKKLECTVQNDYGIHVFFPGSHLGGCISWLIAVSGIRIRRIRMFLGLPDPDPDSIVRGMDPDPAPDPSLFP